MDATVKIMCRLLFARDTLPSALLLSKATSGLSDNMPRGLGIREAGPAGGDLTQ